MTPAFLKTMAKDLMLLPGEAVRLARTAPHRYKVYTVAKRRGTQRRTIAQPARIIKAMQRWVMENMLDGLPLHEYAMGYRKGKNIADNAAVHAPNSYLLKLDFSNFFPSIKYRDVMAYLAACGPLVGSLPDETSRDLLARLLLWDPKDGDGKRLSIGAPSSPLVSNLLMYQFDEVVSALSQANGLVYTRYADDLAFSGENFERLKAVHDGVNVIVGDQNSPRLVLNQAKIFYGTKAKRRTVTGLVLTNDGEVSLGRSRKRLIRSMVHHALNEGWSGDERNQLLALLYYKLIRLPGLFMLKYGLNRRPYVYTPTPSIAGRC